MSSISSHILKPALLMQLSLTTDFVAIETTAAELTAATGVDALAADAFAL